MRYLIIFLFLISIPAKAETIFLKCITTKKEIDGKENNIVTGEPNKLDEAVQFIKIDTKDRDAIQSERGIAWVYFNKTANRNKKETYVTTEAINRFDLSRIEHTVKISDDEASKYKKLWKNNKNEKTFFQINKMIAIKYLNIAQYPKGNFGLKQEYQCEKVNKQF